MNDTTDIIRTDSPKIPYDEHEMLKFLIENGNIDMDDVAAEMRRKENERILTLHPYKIWHSNDGRWHTYVRDDLTGGVRKQVAKSTLEELHFYLYDHYRNMDKEPVFYPTVENLYPDWLKYKALHTEASTYVERIERDWRKYYKDTAIVKKPITDLTKLDLDIWAHTLIKDYWLTKKSYYNITVIMRQVLRYAVDREIIPKSPFDAVEIDGRRLFRKEHKGDDNTQVFTRDEQEQLEELAWNDFLNKHHPTHHMIPLAIIFQFQTGVRLSEVCALKFGDVKGDQIWIRRMVRHPSGEVVEHTKGNSEDRLIYLTEKAKFLIDTAYKHRLEEGLKADGSSFIFSMTDDPMPYSAVNKDYYRYCKKIGTYPKTSHKARKTVISALIDGGVNINTIRAMVGHADERTTYKSYVFDRNDEEVKAKLIENALS